MNRTFSRAQLYPQKLRKNILWLFMSLSLVQFMHQSVKEPDLPQEFKSLHINTVVTTDCKRTETQ